jgi:hypothetical protein
MEGGVGMDGGDMVIVQNLHNLTNNLHISDSPRKEIGQ